MALKADAATPGLKLYCDREGLGSIFRSARTPGHPGGHGGKAGPRLQSPGGGGRLKTLSGRRPGRLRREASSRGATPPAAADRPRPALPHARGPEAGRELAGLRRKSASLARGSSRRRPQGHAESQTVPTDKVRRCLPPTNAWARRGQGGLREGGRNLNPPPRQGAPGCRPSDSGVLC